MPFTDKQYNIRVIAFVLLLLSCSCNKVQETDDTNIVNNDGTYFPIKQFILYQWNANAGTPIVLTRVATLNGQKDSSLVSAFKVDWGSIFRIFAKTDIGDPKFLGQYEGSDFMDSTTDTRILYYKAKDPKLFTQTLQVSMDAAARVKTIYIETHEHSFWNDKSQKLYYTTMKTLQIQESEKPLIGTKKEMVVAYHF